MIYNSDETLVFALESVVNSKYDLICNLNDALSFCLGFIECSPKLQVKCQSNIETCAYDNVVIIIMSVGVA